MTLHLNFPHHRHSTSSAASNAEQANEIREARRFLRDRVRNDWEYSTLPAWKSSGRVRKSSRGDESEVEERIAGFKFHAPSDLEREKKSAEGLGLEFDPLEWRERAYSSNDDDDDDDEVESVAAASKSSVENTYKFEGPESVGTQLREQRAAKKRKRFVALSEEMEWNDGLAHWTRRRDAWCCARTATKVNLANTTVPPTLEDGDTASASSSSPRSSTSSTMRQSSTPSSSPSTTPDLPSAPKTPTSNNNTTTLIAPTEQLIPLAPPLLPNHPIRRKITPSMYPEIYTKIILQSRTPSVPINLQTLVTALVQGWKDDGEWPPKTAAPLEKSFARKRGSKGGLREGVKAVGRVLRLTGTSEMGRGDG